MEFNTNFENEKDYIDFVKFLESNSKNETPEYYERHKAIINCPRKIISIKMETIRKIAKEIAKGNYENFLSLAKDDTYEEVLIQGLVITNLKDIQKQLSYLENWILKIDCWALCDGVVSNMKNFAKSPLKEEKFQYFYDMCFDDREFVSRFGIIVLMSYYIDDEHIDKILTMSRTIKNTAFYVQMANAWLLSVCFVKQREKTLSLIKEKCLDKFTQNKTISKCRDSFRVSSEDKELLKTFRI